MLITKRDGTKQNFDITKVRRAMLMALDDSKTPNAGVGPLVERAINRIVNEPSPTVINIQDAIETEMVESGFTDAARSFIKYRLERDSVRTQRLKPDMSALPEYIHMTKYARYLPELSRRETYAETVRRLEDMHILRYPNHSDMIREAFSYVYTKRVLPSMRSMQFGGAKILEHNASIYNCSFTHIDRVDVFSEIMYLLLCGCGVGYSVQWRHVDKLPPVTNPGREVLHYTIPDKIEGWADAIKALFESYLLPDRAYVEFNYSLIRAEGTPLITAGGLAPGHRGLKRSLEACRLILDAAIGRPLRPLECHDMICHIAEAVLSGGIRRSSLISLFSPEDTEMMYCKARGNFSPSWEGGGYNTQREMANNSVVLLRDAEQWSVYERSLKVSSTNFGDPGFYMTNDLDYGCNPCFAPDTRIATSKGLQRIDSMNLESNMLVQRDGSLLPSTASRITGYRQQLFGVELEDGSYVEVTEYHRFPINGVMVQCKDLKIGDTVELQASGGQFGESGSYEEGLVAGLYLGDGTSDKYGCYLGLWSADYKWKDYIKDVVNSVYETDYSWYESGNGLRLGGAALRDLDKSVPESVWTGTKEMIQGFLDGLQFTDGCFQGAAGRGYTLRISQSDLGLLRDVKILFQQLGIASKIRLSHPARRKEMPGGTYDCKTNYELILYKNAVCKYMTENKPLGRNYAKFQNSGYKYDLFKYDPAESKIKSIAKTRKSDVWCLSQPETELVSANGMILGQCGEIGMWPRWKNPDTGVFESGFSFCNLCEVNGALVTDAESLRDSARAAAIIGTLQAGYTDFKYLGSASSHIARRDALLGVGIMGIMNCPDILLNPSALSDAAGAAVVANTGAAAKLGIRPAARVTTVKPGGTAPLEASDKSHFVGSGIHAHWSRRWIHGVTANVNEPYAQRMLEINPHMVKRKPNGDLFLQFPMEVPDSAITVKEQTANDQLDNILTVYKNWVVPGTVRSSIEGRQADELTHNVSCTITVREGELNELIDRIWKLRYFVCALTFVPYSIDTIYAYAPRQAVIGPEHEARFNELVAHYKPLGIVHETHDVTTRQMEAACSGGKCEI